MTTAHLFLVALCAASPNAPSEDPDTLAFDITVESAEGTERALSATAPSVTVIGPKEIRTSGAIRVSELLRRVPGVDITRSGSAGRATVARIGGATAAQTLVLLNGVELNSPTLGLADLSDIMVDDVERIEVVRGPMSAMYGSEAVGGLINIVTRRGVGAPAFTVELSGGAWSTTRGSVSSRGALSDALAYSFAVSRLDSDGRELDTPAGRLTHDAYENTTASFGIQAMLGDATSLDFDLRYTDASRELPLEVFGSQVFDVNARQADETSVVSMRLRSQLRDRLAAFARFGLSNASQDFDDPVDPTETGPFASDFNAQIDTNRTELTAGAEYNLDDSALITAGVEYDLRQGKNRDNFGGVNFDDERQTLAAFLHGRFDIDSALSDGDSLVINAGARLDDADGFGSEVSPRVSALWTTSGGGFRLRAGAGRGFRAPSLNEVLFPFFGNPDLEPEVARTYEAAIGGRLFEGRLDVEARLFRSDFDDLITTDPSTFTAINLDQARVHGADVELKAQPVAGLWLRGSLTLQDAEDRQSGERLLRRPERKGSFTVAYARPRKFRISMDIIATGEQRDVLVDGFPEMNPGWTRVDLAGGYTLPMASQVEVFGRVENLFDEEYSESTGFTAPGVNAYGGVRVLF